MWVTPGTIMAPDFSEELGIMFRNVAHDKSAQITSAFKQVLLGTNPWRYRKDRH